MRIPSGKSGDWEIVNQGMNVFLVHHHPKWGDRAWMSDGIIEEQTNAKFHRNAKGNVLIAGLGVGYNISVLKDKPDVISITVVEKEVDVINLVWKHVKCPKANIVCDSILHYLTTTCGIRYNTIFFDIFGGNGELDYPEETEILKNASQRALERGGNILFWRSSIEVEL